MGGIIALVAALGFSFESIMIRKGLIEENPGKIWDIRLLVNLTTLVIYLAAALTAMLFSFDLISEFREITLQAVLLLVFAGIIGPLIGSTLMSLSVSQIGASHASALWGGSNPIFAAVLAFFFLNEVPSLIGIISIAIIVSGIVTIGYHGHAGTEVLLEKTKLSGGLFALLSGLCFAFAFIGRGAALKLGATPNTSVFIDFMTSSLFALMFVLIKESGKLGHLKNISRKSIFNYFIAGLGVVVGAYGIFVAFTLIPVWQAAAIRNVQPILVLIISRFLLQKVDQINFRLVLGSLLVTAGVVILNLF